MKAILEFDENHIEVYKKYREEIKNLARVFPAPTSSLPTYDEYSDGLELALAVGFINGYAARINETGGDSWVSGWMRERGQKEDIKARKDSILDKLAGKLSNR